MPHLTKTISMELSKEEAKKEFPFSFDEKTGEPHGKIPKYPDGLEISLGNISLKKLGMTIEDFKLKATKTIYLHAEVVKVKHEEVLGEEPEMMVRLQVTDIGFGDEEGPLEELMFKE